MKKIDRNLDYILVKEKIIQWIKSYVKDNDIKSLIIGVSGGIDSAVVSTLCAYTSIKTYTILLPLNQDINQLSRGEKHVNWLTNTFSNVENIKIDLSNLFCEYKNTMNKELHDDLAFANSKSRLRMLTLYHIAQIKNGIVVGTGNKVEDFGIGFFTKYGDGAVDISPIADLYKSEVYNLSKILGVSEDIINAKPTDGLWDDNRNDEDQIGASYDELEWAMNYENKIEILTEKEKNIIYIYKNLNNKNKHKMVEIPIFKI